jgi:prephenate dehydratase
MTISLLRHDSVEPGWTQAPRIDGSHAYLGPVGTFSEAAAGALAGDPGRTVPFATVRGALDAVRTGECAAAVIPLENTVSGAVPTTLGELAAAGSRRLRIDAQVEIPVTFAVLGAADTELAAVRRVLSHPHALSQCQGWIAANLPQAETEVCDSTAAAAQRVSREADPTRVAIASPGTAARYGLSVLASGVGDHHGAVTRFIRLVPEGALVPATGRDRSSFLLGGSVSGAGELVGILSEFTTRAVPLPWLHSWPAGPGGAGYRYFVDAEGHIEDAPVAEAVEALRRRSVQVSFLGSYPRGRAGETEVAA